MNTKFQYFYRDACNYKSSARDVVCAGGITQEEMDAVYCEDFVPQYMGLESLQEELQGFDENDNRDAEGVYDPYGPDGDDHLMHEWFNVAETDEIPTDARTTAEFIRQFCDGVACNWNIADTLAELRDATRGSK